MLLQKQYRETCFKKYYELISCLLVSEQNNELFPEVNAISSNHNCHGSKGGEGRYNHRPNDNKNASTVVFKLIVAWNSFHCCCELLELIFPQKKSGYNREQVVLYKWIQGQPVEKLIMVQKVLHIFFKLLRFLDRFIDATYHEFTSVNIAITHACDHPGQSHLISMQQLFCRFHYGGAHGGKLPVTLKNVTLQMKIMKIWGVISKANEKELEVGFRWPSRVSSV
ncbi:hypothetical protein LXL04_033610 [Taraxacum kok-saghyz]